MCDRHLKSSKASILSFTQITNMINCTKSETCKATNFKIMWKLKNTGQHNIY